MTTIADVRTELANVLSTIPGWSVASFPSGAANPYVGDYVSTYMFKVSRPAFDPRVIFGESKIRLTFTVGAYAPRATPEESERRLDALCDLTGDDSLVATVQDGTRWAVDVDYAMVTQCGEVQAITWIDGVDYLACQFQIEVVW